MTPHPLDTCQQLAPVELWDREAAGVVEEDRSRLWRGLGYGLALVLPIYALVGWLVMRLWK